MQIKEFSIEINRYVVSKRFSFIQLVYLDLGSLRPGQTQATMGKSVRILINAVLISK